MDCLTVISNAANQTELCRRASCPQAMFFRLKQLIKGDFPHALYHLSMWIDFPIRNNGVLSYYELLFEFFNICRRTYVR